MATINEIKQQAAAVKNATQVGENTAERVGGALSGLADIVEQQDSKLSDLSSSLNDLSSKTIDIFNFTPDCAVNQKGELIANNEYCITSKIDVSNLVGKSIIWASGSDKQDLVVASLAFYDSSDAFSSTVIVLVECIL